MRLCASCGRPLSGPGWQCGQCGWIAQKINGIDVLLRDSALKDAAFPTDDFAALSAIEQDYFWFRARARLILWAFERYAKGCRNFLEIGCGTGFVLSAIGAAHPNLIAWGSEAHAEGLQHARRRWPRLLQMDARSIPFADEFDAIGMFDVLEHIEEDELVLAQVHRALTPGGTLLITVPQHRFLWSASDELAHHVRRYPRSELVAKIERARFEVVRCTSFVSTLFPLLVASRWLRRTRASDSLAEYRIPRFANRVLEVALSAERTVIRSGFSLPFGGSLLLVARRRADPVS